MKKILFLICFTLLLGVGAAKAQSIMIHYTNGEIKTFELGSIGYVSFSEISQDFEGFLNLNYSDGTQNAIPMEEIKYVSFVGNQGYPYGAGNCYVYEVDSWLNSGTVNEDLDKKLVAGNWWYSFSKDGIDINGEIDYPNMAAYYGCLGFYLDPDTVNKYFDMASTEFETVNNSTLAIFYPLNGAKEDISDQGWSTYQPGMWYDAKGNSSSWTAGAAYWYYQIYESQASSYDFKDASGYKKAFVLLGQRPNNKTLDEDSVYTSYNILNGKNWNIHISYRGVPEKVKPDTIPDDLTHGEGTTAVGHKYKFDISEKGIFVECTINMDTLTGSWEMMSFNLGTNAISKLIGDTITKIGKDLTKFYPVEPDGTKGTSWSSYAPGQWVDLNGATSNWSSGYLYWQYQCVENYDGHTDLGDFVLGTNPTNVAKVTDGTTIVSKAKLKDYDFVVTVNFRTKASMQSLASGSGSCTLRNMDKWINDGQEDTSIDPAISTGSWSYDITGAGITINGKIDVQKCGENGPCLGFYLSPDTLAKYLGVAPDETDISTFYPLDGSGAQLKAWTAYAPGQWIDATGAASDANKGPAFWYYQVYSDSWYDLLEDANHFKEGYFVMGKLPNSANIEEGTTYTSKAMYNGKSWTVNISYYDTEKVYDDPDTPTGSGTTAKGHAYSWNIDKSGIKIDCTINTDSLTGSWEMMSFTLGRKQISTLIGEDVATAAADTLKFYPVLNDGTTGKWTSYAPGEWVDADGNGSSYSTGVMYWQYQCVKNYDAHTNLGDMVIGTNPSNTAAMKGKSVTSKAKLLGYDFIVTVKFE